MVRIPYQRVWRPDIILYNNADAQYTSSVINTNVIVSDNGEVSEFDSFMNLFLFYLKLN